MTQVVELRPGISGLMLQRDCAAAAGYQTEATSAATRRAYRGDMAIFSAWCGGRGETAIPASPGAVAAFLASQARGGSSPATLVRRVAAIRYAHRLAGLPAPTDAPEVRTVMRGIKRTLGTAPVQKRPVTAERLSAMLAACPDTLKGKRDRALLALGFAGAFRRSELVALTVADMEVVPDGMRVLIRRSKTDQEGEGREVCIPNGEAVRPVEAVQAWLRDAGISDGPVFRAVDRYGRVGRDGLTGESVAEVVKLYAAAAGLDPADVGGHSLRSGFLTSAAEAGASLERMMDVSRHRKPESVIGYIRRADGFRDHAGAAFL
jgi:site-specific recombinase XerD